MKSILILNMKRYARYHWDTFTNRWNYSEDLKTFLDERKIAYQVIETIEVGKEKILEEHKF